MKTINFAITGAGIGLVSGSLATSLINGILLLVGMCCLVFGAIAMIKEDNQND